MIALLTKRRILGLAGLIAIFCSATAFWNTYSPAKPVSQIETALTVDGTPEIRDDDGVELKPGLSICERAVIL